MAVALVVGALKAGTLATGGIVAWQLEHGPTISMAIAGIAFFLALQAQAGKLPFDIPEADQEIMGGPLIEQSGPRLALFRWALWVRSSSCWRCCWSSCSSPGRAPASSPSTSPLTLVKAFVVLVLVAVVDVVNPQAAHRPGLGYYLRVAFSALAALAFAVIGM